MITVLKNNWVKALSVLGAGFVAVVGFAPASSFQRSLP